MKVLILTALFERIDQEWPLPGGPTYRYRGPREYLVRIPGLAHNAPTAGEALDRVLAQVRDQIEYCNDTGKETFTTAITLADEEETAGERAQLRTYGEVFFPPIEIPLGEQVAA